MIKSAAITNFQSHRATNFDFSPGINVIIGESDRGKSAALRAIMWCLTNKPAGDSFVSHWIKTKKDFIKQGEECSVLLTTGKGYVKRFKNSGTNGYNINGNPLEALGRGNIPTEVEEFFNMGEANIQRQLDSPFLLTQTSGEIARFFNGIIKLDSIDKALGLIDSQKRETKSDINAEEKKALTLKAEITALHWVRPLKARIEELEDVWMELVEKKERLARLRTLLTNIRETQRKLDRFKTLNDTKALLNTAEVVKDRLDTLIEDNIKLKQIIEVCTNANIRILVYTNILMVGDKIALAEKIGTRIVGLKEKQEELRKLILVITKSELGLNRLKQIDFPGLSEKLEWLGKNDIAEQKLNLYKFKDLINNVRKTTQLVYNKEKEIEVIKTQFPETCPTCGGAFKI